ncbi:hypothetical protein BSIN_4961 [Burkholderia singularis]|uniref:Uncharacterized protein n=1 Tax=Burkholderia singularis TaxID=1503053 RepID=A0A238HBP5_9BURK|nr:hypothetical protein BSIN_4961 [Burkholderia singularis]
MGNAHRITSTVQRVSARAHRHGAFDAHQYSLYHVALPPWHR